MIRKLMASTAVFALISAGALTATAAETKTQAPAAQQDLMAAPASESTAATDVLKPEQPTLASVYIGRSVFSGEGDSAENIGDVNDLIVGENGDITDAVVGVGGFLGIGEKNVAVPFEKLKVVEENGDIRLIYSATREELEAAPALDRTAYDPIARYNEQQAAANAGNAGAPLAPTAPGDAMSPAPDAMADNAPQPADMTAPATAPAPEEQPTAAAGMEPDTAASTDEAATADTGATNDAAALSDQAAAGASTSNDQVNTADATNNANATAAANDQMAANTMTPAPASAAGQEFLTFDATQVRASSVIGANVFNNENETVGKVSDIVVDKDGTSRLVLIDVGGFLGIGAKTVGLPFSDLHFKEALDGAASDRTPTTEIVVDLSRDQLNGMPEYQEPEQAAALAPADATAPVDQTAMAPSADTTAPAENDMAANPPANDNTATTSGENIVTGSVASGYQPASQEMKTSDLMGLSVYGPDDATVGEIGDIVFDQKGDIQAVVIDVGGFLGMGEKPVAIGYDKLQIRTDENGTRTAMVGISKEQFDAAPAFTVEGTTDAGTTVQ